MRPSVTAFAGSSIHPTIRLVHPPPTIPRFISSADPPVASIQPPFPRMRLPAFARAMCRNVRHADAGEPAAAARCQSSLVPNRAPRSSSLKEPAARSRSPTLSGSSLAHSRTISRARSQGLQIRLATLFSRRACPWRARRRPEEGIAHASRLAAASACARVAPPPPSLTPRFPPFGRERSRGCCGRANSRLNYTHRGARAPQWADAGWGSWIGRERERNI